MHLKCKACNIALDEFTIKSTNPHTGEPEDMCSSCRVAATSEYSVLTDHEWGHTAATGEAPVPKRGYYYDWND